MKERDSREAQDERHPLYDEELEKNIVGHLLNCTSQQIHEVRDIIETDYFYLDKTRNLYRIICKINDDGEEVTQMKVTPLVMKFSHLLSLADYTDIVCHSFLNYYDLQDHLGLLVNYAKQRKVWEMGHRMIACPTDSEDISKLLSDIKDGISEVENGKDKSDIVSMKETIDEVIQIAYDNLKGINTKRRHPTGFRWIDEKGGFQASDLIIIAAGSSIGKTSLADSIGMNMIRANAKIVFFSMEMTREQLTARLLSPYTKLYSNTMLMKPLSTLENQQFMRGIDEIMPYASNMFFADKSSSTLDSILSEIRRQKAKNDIDGVIVDYLQLIGGQKASQKDEAFLAECARRLKNIAKELDIFVIALSQLNRDRENPVPSNDRLRGSGQILDAADVVILIHRPQFYNDSECKNLRYPIPYENVSTDGTALIMVSKGRNIGTGNFICGFDSNYTHFYDLDDVPTTTAQEKIRKEQQMVIPDDPNNSPF